MDFWNFSHCILLLFTFCTFIFYCAHSVLSFPFLHICTVISFVHMLYCNLLLCKFVLYFSAYIGLYFTFMHILYCTFLLSTFCTVPCCSAHFILYSTLMLICTVLYCTFTVSAIKAFNGYQPRHWYRGTRSSELRTASMTL